MLSLQQGLREGIQRRECERAKCKDKEGPSGLDAGSAVGLVQNDVLLPKISCKWRYAHSNLQLHLAKRVGKLEEGGPRVSKKDALQLQDRLDLTFSLI